MKKKVNQRSKQTIKEAKIMNEKYVELLESILKEMVKYPDEIKVVRTTDEMGVLLMVKMNPEDAGLVIGREGKTIGAIRYIMLAIGMRNRAKINIKLDVPDRAPRTEQVEEKDPLEDLK